MDSYKTIEGTAQAEYEEKKSRFIGQVAHVETEEEAVGSLEGVRATMSMRMCCGRTTVCGIRTMASQRARAVFPPFQS